MIRFHLRKSVFSAVALVLAFCFSSCGFFEYYSREEQLTMLRVTDERPHGASDRSVRQLIDAVQRATDPKKDYLNAEKYLLRQTAVSEKEVDDRRTSEEYAMEIRFSQPDFLRWTHSRNGKSFYMAICRGGNVWNIDTHTLKSEQIPEGTGLNMFRNMIAMANPRKTYLDIFKDVTIDMVVEDERECYRLVCQSYDDDIAPYVVYVDAHSFLTVKVETIQYQDDGTQTLYTSIPTEYTWFGNVLFPRTTTITTSRGKVISKVTEFILNPKIPDSDFELPKRFQVPLE